MTQIVLPYPMSSFPGGVQMNVLCFCFCFNPNNLTLKVALKTSYTFIELKPDEDLQNKVPANIKQYEPTT